MLPLSLAELLTEFVDVLDTIPVVLPVLHSEALVVLKSVNEEITVSDCVQDRESSSSTHSIGVGWELSALHQDASDVGVLFKSLLYKCHDPGLYFNGVYLAAFSDGFKARDMFTPDDNKPVLVCVDTTFFSN